MGTIFNPPKPDTKAADEARRKAEAEAAKLERENQARLRNINSRRTGRSLLAYSDTGTQGVTDLKDKLGG